MKYLISLLVLVMLVSVPVLANVDVGSTQDFPGNNYLRIDVANLLFEIPLKDRLNQFRLGGKLNTPIYDLYAVGKLPFRYNYSAKEFKLNPIYLGFGYPIRMGSVKLRGELTMTAPVWSKTNDWGFSALLGAQFSWEKLFFIFGTEGGE